MIANRRDLTVEERNAIWDATGGGEAYCLAVEAAECVERGSLPESGGAEEEACRKVETMLKGEENE